MLDELPFDVEKFTFYACCEGPALDIFAVRDVVIEFQRLDVPLNLGVGDEQAARDDVETARSF